MTGMERVAAGHEGRRRGRTGLVNYQHQPYTNQPKGQDMDPIYCQRCGDQPTIAHPLERGECVNCTDPDHYASECEACPAAED